MRSEREDTNELKNAVEHRSRLPPPPGLPGGGTLPIQPIATRAGKKRCAARPERPSHATGPRRPIASERAILQRGGVKAKRKNTCADRIASACDRVTVGSRKVRAIGFPTTVFESMEMFPDEGASWHYEERQGPPDRDAPTLASVLFDLMAQRRIQANQRG